MTIFILILLLIIGWDFAWYTAGVKPLFPWHLKKLLKEKSDQLTIIDVRTPLEYKWRSAATSINIQSSIFIFQLTGIADTILETDGRSALRVWLLSSG